MIKQVITLFLLHSFSSTVSTDSFIILSLVWHFKHSKWLDWKKSLNIQANETYYISTSVLDTAHAFRMIKQSMYTWHCFHSKARFQKFIFITAENKAQVFLSVVFLTQLGDFCSRESAPHNCAANITSLFWSFTVVSYCDNKTQKNI